MKFILCFSFLCWDGWNEWVDRCWCRLGDDGGRLGGV